MKEGKSLRAATQELADVMICALSFANRTVIDVAKALKKRCSKIRNNTRCKLTKADSKGHGNQHCTCLSLESVRVQLDAPRRLGWFARSPSQAIHDLACDQALLHHFKFTHELGHHTASALQVLGAPECFEIPAELAHFQEA